MNDRYFFKAKRIDNGEWVQGYYSYYPNGFGSEVREDHIIKDTIKGRVYFIDPTTLCQCTGLKDKAGTLIWENDIVYARCNGLSGKGVVKFENGCFVLKDRKRNRNYSLFGEWKFRIDGNIFDNPELLEKKERN